MRLFVTICSDRVHIGLDFFDASINRIAAWVIGTLQYEKALLRALLEPTAELRQAGSGGRLHCASGPAGRAKSLPWQAVWEMYCQRHDTPAGSAVAGQRAGAYEKKF
ncbi:L-rhamnose isomerase [Escherichia coli]|nr:L-rhamnose isomerase [Escherichia coli]